MVDSEPWNLFRGGLSRWAGFGRTRHPFYFTVNLLHHPCNPQNGLILSHFHFHSRNTERAEQMKGNPKVIELLNEGLCAELTAINQFFIHSRMNADWGYDTLAKKYYEESIEEMKHAENIIDRILFLEGVPDMQKYHKVLVGATVPDQFENDLPIWGNKNA